MKFNRLFSGMALAGVMTLSANAFAAMAPASDFKVVGYFPSWQGSTDAVQYDKLTHINYAFLLPNADGTLKPLEGSHTLKALVQKAHAQNVKVGIAIGGWNGGDDSAFETLASNPVTRTAFVTNVMAFVNQYGLDGVDMDWEYPDPGTSADNFALLMGELSQALRAEGKFLTAAVVALGYTGNGIKPEVFDDIDFLNLMAYDKNNGDHASYQFAVESIQYWQAKGLSKEKTVLGTPFYSRPGWKKYKDIVAIDPAQACLDTLTKDANGNVISTNYYNGIPTIAKKTQLALDTAGGIMNWELTQDTNDDFSLLKAMNDTIKGNPIVACDGNEPPVKPDPDKPAPENSWHADVIYVGGEIVVFEDKQYKSKWWTKGEKPGNPHGPWALIPDVSEGPQEWVATVTYTAGMQVVYQQMIYEARYWTLGDTPGKAHVWLEIGPVAPPVKEQVLFDDFSYQSNSDPALTASVWSLRTWGGGPGVPGASWSKDNITFTADPNDAANRVMTLHSTTSGKPENTVQAEIATKDRRFLEGTYAARVKFSDMPLGGAPDGDNVVQTFFSITPLAADNDPDYSEIDFEYLSNGGWGMPEHVMYTTTWETVQVDPWLADNLHTYDRASYAGWHDLVFQVADGEVKYYIDGKLFANHGGHVYPESKMFIAFNQWFINLQSVDSTETRIYEQQVDWVFHQKDTVLSPDEVKAKVEKYRADNVAYKDTVK
ncbi:glycosyl hydrolase family 18 protein [Photobacterium aphoticum]|uniref:glycosyl hydrolase family 18 protein n=1 Tax=Photobacterium aphoticum TaxID=754436 RepID=UPI000ADEFFB5|nr:glycosyl hydrolase family 18 protein [Photobacterium aphoticum]